MLHGDRKKLSEKIYTLNGLDTFLPFVDIFLKPDVFKDAS